MSIFGKRQYYAGLTEATAETDGRRAEIDADSYQFGHYGSWSEAAFYLDSSLKI